MNSISKNQKPFRSGYVALVGRPNVGKSTLLNGLLQEKLAIVSPKPQTTRNRILGILSGQDYQILFLDTPGVIRPEYLLQQTMVRATEKSLEEADIIIMLTEPGKSPQSEQLMLSLLEKRDTPKLLVINKIDTIPKGLILPLIDSYRSIMNFKEIIPISALKREGLDTLLSCILDSLPEGDLLYPADMLTSEPEKFFVSEIIREQIFLLFEKEIPYSTSVQINTFKERPGRKDYIEAVITVERQGQKGILIGSEGSMLKKVGARARKVIETFLQRPVYLKLTVRVREKWRQNPDQLKNMGYF